ncbi:MAG: FkbM family methyltransferase, partial [Caldilineaceae bacterium]
MILRSLLPDKQDGFYVDVGAYQPKRFSNTYHFYQRGWRGINIDATPGAMSLFNKQRSRDTNLEIAVSSEPQNLTFYMFNEPAVNTFDSDLAEERRQPGKYVMVGQVTIATRRLDDILDEYLPPGQQIDILAIDVEGYDMQVLLSNDWKRYRPSLVLIEDAYIKSGESGLDAAAFLADKG